MEVPISLVFGCCIFALKLWRSRSSPESKGTDLIILQEILFLISSPQRELLYQNREVKSSKILTSGLGDGISVLLRVIIFAIERFYGTRR